MHLNISSLPTGLLLAVSSLSFAGSMAGIIVEKSPEKVTLPCQRSSFQLGLYGMYLQPSYSGQLPYIDTNSTVSNSGSTASTQNINVNEKWDWAAMIEGGFHFNCGNDITVSWLHYKNDKTQSYRSSSLDIDPITFLYINFPFNGTATTSLTFNRIDIEIGQQVDFGEMMDIRFHGGFEYADFDFTMTANETGITDTRFTNYKQKTAKFNGFGPKIGMDLTYNVLDGLSVYGKSSVAALVWTTKSQNQQGFVDPTIPDLTTTFNGKQDNQIVPVIALNVGFQYTWVIFQNVYSLDAGYMWSDYMAIARNLDAETGRPTDANFYLQGPYIGIRWIGQA